MAEIEDKERFTDPIDAGCAAAETWIADKIAEHRHQLSIATIQYEQGRCRNCNDKLDDGRAYCDKDCADDHANRIRADKRRGNK